MAIFGLSTQREVQQQIKEAIDATLKAQAQSFPYWALQTAEAEEYNLPNPEIYGNQADLYRKLSWVLQACQLTGENAAVVPFGVGRIIAGQEPKDIPNHEFEMLLRNPNPLDSRFEFINATVISYKLNGNAYWWLNRKDQYSAPDEIWFIPPHMITPVPDGRMFLRGYLYYPGNGDELALEPHEIVHFKRFNPFSRFVGLSAIEAIANVAIGDLGMQEWNTRLFKENNARLPGILAFKEFIEQTQWDKIKDDTREASRKRELLMLRGVGDSVNWIQNAVSQREMEFLAGRKANAKEIMDTVAPGSYTMLYENATEANSRTGKAVFNDLNLYPMLTMMGEKITKGILSAYRSDRARPLVGAFEDVRVTDKQLAIQEIEQFAKFHPIDEVRREKYGDDPIGDERGKLLISQINAQSGGIQEPPPSPFGNGKDEEEPKEKPGMEKEMEAEENKPPKDADEKEKDTTTKAMLDDLARYERKALKRVGEAVEFTSDVLPSPTLDAIRGRLPECKTAEAVKAVFSNARSTMRSNAPQASEAAMVLEAIKLALTR